MKNIDRDVLARYPALPSYVMRLGSYNGMSKVFLAEQGVTHSRDVLDARVTGLAIAYGYGKDTTRFLRDIALNRTVDFDKYAEAWETLEVVKVGNGGKSTWRYTPGERMSTSDPFMLTLKGNRFVLSKHRARRNLMNYGTKDYEVSRYLGRRNGKRVLVDEVPPGKLPAKSKSPRILRKPRGRRRSHRPGPNR